jgi:hypothetical protein
MIISLSGAATSDADACGLAGYTPGAGGAHHVIGILKYPPATSPEPTSTSIASEPREFALLTKWPVKAELFDCQMLYRRRPKSLTVT